MATNNMINSPEPFGLAIGGTGAALVASNGGIFYSTASAGAILAGTATAGQALVSGANSAPSWTTATFPLTTTINQLLYSNATNTVVGLATVNNAVLTTTNTGVPTWLALSAGQIIIGATSAAPAAGTLSAGTGISIVNAANSITISATGLGLTWTTVTGATQNAAVNNGYVANHAATPVVFTLPATAPLGSIVIVRGLAGSGGWTITANSGQTIQFGNQASTTAGSWSSADAGDSAEATCIVANTTWTLTDVVSAGLTKV